MVGTPTSIYEVVEALNKLRRLPALVEAIVLVKAVPPMIVV